jgi:prepilin-type N-terminal cleavage/methylation domain-containing protein
VSALRLLRRRHGVTVVELLIAMVVLGIILGGAATFLRGQGSGFARGTDRMDLLQNARYGVEMISREARTAGSNVLEGQPFLVYADSMVLAFNADLVSNVLGDLAAVYVDPDAPDGAVTSLRSSDKATLPGTTFQYPDTTYVDFSMVESAAETVVYFFRPDSSTARGDDYLMMRQVNRQPPELITRNVLKTTGQRFFQYFRAIPTGNGRPQAVPVAQLPLRHTVPIHHAPADTGAAAVIDFVRGVRIQYTVTNGQSGSEERRRAISRLVALPSSGQQPRKSCGDEPILGAPLNATAVVLEDGTGAIELTWDAAVDEFGGEEDVVRYVLWRRNSGSWGDPFLGLAAGQASYTYNDRDVSVGVAYEYALSAQDCTPALSARATAGPITPLVGEGGAEDEACDPLDLLCN